MGDLLGFVINISIMGSYTIVSSS